jgi:hypothetical protein
MLCSEFSANTNSATSPEKSSTTVIIDQALRGCPQIIKLSFIYLGLPGCNISHSQIFIGQAAMRPLCFEIFYCLIVVRRIGFFAG